MEEGRVAGIRAIAPDSPVEIRADLVVAADGRDSFLREAAGLIVDEIGAPMDELWMRLSRQGGEPKGGRIVSFLAIDSAASSKKRC